MPKTRPIAWATTSSGSSWPWVTSVPALKPVRPVSGSWASTRTVPAGTYSNVYRPTSPALSVVTRPIVRPPATSVTVPSGMGAPAAPGMRKRPVTVPVVVTRTSTSTVAPGAGRIPEARPPRAFRSDASTAKPPSKTRENVARPSLAGERTVSYEPDG